MLILHHIILAAALIAALPYLLIRSAIDPAFREDMNRRLEDWKEVPFLSGCIWIHAASVGEVRVAKTLIENIRAEIGEDKAVILSTFTKTGFKLAKEQGIRKVFRLPPDLAFFIRPLLEKLDPSVLVLVEAELWPALLHVCKERKVPVLALNGRMSRKSFRRYKLARPVFQWMAEGVSHFAMRTEADAAFLRQLGTAEDKISVTGNMKFDALAVGQTGSHANDDDRPFVIFASTRPGDEEPILDAIVRLRKEISGRQFALAPRHLHRCGEIETMIAQRGLRVVLHTSQIPDAADQQPDLILINEMGELDQYYRRACVAFVGGGFNPKHGGHNILEPALYSLPVIFGKHMNNFLEEARLLVESGGGLQLDNPDELYPALLRLLTNPEEARERGGSALETIRQNQGAAKKNAVLIRKTLNAA